MGKDKIESEVLLIDAVRKRQLLYDKSNASYKDQNKKTVVWNTIADEAGLLGMLSNFYNSFCQLLIFEFRR